jgi:hypothetical protein
MKKLSFKKISFRTLFVVSCKGAKCALTDGGMGSGGIQDGV